MEAARGMDNTEGSEMNIVTDYQFIITDNVLKKASNCLDYHFDNRTIYYDKRFSLIEIFDSNQIICAVIIGFVYLSGEDFFSNIKEYELSVDTINEVEDKILPCISGSFILITFGKLPYRLYMDHGGSIPVVYDRETGIISTTPALFLNKDDHEKRFWKELHRDLMSKEKNGAWISGTLTAYHSIFRLLPNFYLDIERLEQYRYWPKNILSWMQPHAAVNSINQSIKQFTTAAINSFRVFHTLTAGFDSRLLLSACKEIKEKCTFFTMDTKSACIDSFVANRISKIESLKHIKVKIKQSNEEDKLLWDMMVGYSVKETNREIFRTLDQLDTDCIITGMYGEIGRCRLYRQDYKTVNQIPLTLNALTSRLTLPLNTILSENIEIWLATLEGQYNSIIFDLAFHELKFGSWAMGQHPIQNSLKFNLLPFAQRPVIESFLRISPEDKTTEKLFRQCIISAWPELLNIPINKGGLLKDSQVFLLKLTSLTRIKRYLRDRLARYL